MLTSLAYYGANIGECESQAYSTYTHTYTQLTFFFLEPRPRVHGITIVRTVCSAIMYIVNAQHSLECRVNMLKHLFLPTRQTIVVGGGFAVHAMGYTTQFGDIDIFLPDDVLDIFVSNVEQLNPLFHLQRLERWVYPPPFHT